VTRKDRPRYEFFDHTADVGVRLYAPDLPALFEIAGTALFDLLTDRARIRAVQKLRISLKANDIGELLVGWLQELIYLNEVHGWLFSSFETTGVGETFLDAVVRGERFDPQRHVMNTQVKAATDHHLNVERVLHGGIEACVILDV
jgi:SHS2 domain-containing protein